MCWLLGILLAGVTIIWQVINARVVVVVNLIVVFVFVFVISCLLFIRLLVIGLN